MGKWARERNVILLLVVAITLLSYFIGHFLLLLLLVTIYLLVKQTIQVNQLERWLSQGAYGDNLKAKGIWEDIYYHLYKIKKNEKRRKKRLSKIINQFRKSTNALPDAAVVLGKNTEIEWSNKAARHVLGLKKSDRGQRIPNLIRTPEFVRYLKSDAYDKTINIVSPVNENISLQIIVVPYGAGLRLLIARDITQLNKMERMRKDFVANVSHELRTPLTVLKGYLETLQEMDDCNPTLLRSFQQMFSQTQRMQILVDDLLLLTRLETREIHTECVDIAMLLRQICLEGRILENSDQRISLSIENNDNIQGDPQELRSAFTNLVINALKYSADTEPVSVSWKQTVDGGASLEVEDHGEGISAIEIPRITERFYRIDINRKHKIAGTGLGLSIVKHVLVRHDAKLTVHSELGKGSCFSCIFPKQRIC